MAVGVSCGGRNEIPELVLSRSRCHRRFSVILLGTVRIRCPESFISFGEESNRVHWATSFSTDVRLELDAPSDDRCSMRFLCMAGHYKPLKEISSSCLRVLGTDARTTRPAPRMMSESFDGFRELPHATYSLGNCRFRPRRVRCKSQGRPPLDRDCLLSNQNPNK